MLELKKSKLEICAACAESKFAKLCVYCVFILQLFYILPTPCRNQELAPCC